LPALTRQRLPDLAVKQVTGRTYSGLQVLSQPAAAGRFGRRFTGRAWAAGSVYSG